MALAEGPFLVEAQFLVLGAGRSLRDFGVNRASAWIRCERKAGHARSHRHGCPYAADALDNGVAADVPPSVAVLAHQHVVVTARGAREGQRDRANGAPWSTIGVDSPGVQPTGVGRFTRVVRGSGVVGAGDVAAAADREPKEGDGDVCSHAGDSGRASGKEGPGANGGAPPTARETAPACVELSMEGRDCACRFLARASHRSSSTRSLRRLREIVSKYLLNVHGARLGPTPFGVG